MIEKWNSTKIINLLHLLFDVHVCWHYYHACRSNVVYCQVSPRQDLPLESDWRSHRYNKQDSHRYSASYGVMENGVVPNGYLQMSWWVPDPPENCHLTVKKLPKTWHFYNKIAQNFHFFHWQFFWKKWKFLAIFFLKKCQVFDNFLTVKWQFSGESVWVL